MNTKTFRAVETLYYANNPWPTTENLCTSCYGYSSYEDAYDAIRKSVQAEMDEFNGCDVPDIEDCDEFSFRSDFDGDHVACIRLWDGDDYRTVSEYDIYELEKTGDIIKYQDFEIEKHKNLFEARCSDAFCFNSDLDLLLDHIDSRRYQND